MMMISRLCASGAYSLVLNLRRTYRARMKPSLRAAALRLAALLPLALLLGGPAVDAKPKRVPAPVIVAPAPDPGPWLYRGSDVPQDKEWTFGELPNGLRYAVRHNGVPPDQISIRVRVDAGSLNEAENERGYAHFIEHLVFRQSKYLADGEAIPAWQRLGATFGSDTNAETSPTSTTFKIDLPGATPASIDESFKYLSGMVIAPTLSAANVKTDLPIVLAEKREHGGAAERVDHAMRDTIYAGQPISRRDPIGTEETLNAATEASIRAFHARWYRPENTVVIVAGDADPKALEALVTKWFSDWPVTGPHTATPSFGIPAAGADALTGPGTPLSPVGTAGFRVEPDLPRTVTWSILRPWKQVNDSIAYNQGLMIDHVGVAIINRRLESRARKGGSYLVAQVDGQKISRSSDATYVTVQPISSDWKAAVKDVRGVIEDALASPPTPDEIARELAEMRIVYVNGVEQRDLQPGAELANEIVQALDIRETVAAPETVLGIFDRSKALFTPEAVLAHTRSQFAGTVTRAFMVTPAEGEVSVDALRQAMAAPVAADASVRTSAKMVAFADLPPIGVEAQPKAITPTGLLGIEQLDFANGVKAQIWPTEDEPGRVTVKVRFGAGYRSFTSTDGAVIALGQAALINVGVGQLGEEELDRISTGRKMGFAFRIADANFSFSGDTRRDDLADQLYLFAAKLSQPRWDTNPLVRAKAQSRLQYDALATSPNGVLSRDLDWLQRGRDPRYRMPLPAEVEAVTPERFRKVWEPILLSGPVEVQVFGDIDRNQTVAALSRTFGALKPRMPLTHPLAPAFTAVPVGGGAPFVLTHHGDAAQSAAMVFWPTGGGISAVRDSRQLRILAEVFSNRLLDRMREKLGASYSPQVYSAWPVDLNSGGQITAMAQLQPKDVPAFYEVADEIAADLVARPPSQDELIRVTEPLRQLITRAYTGSNFFMSQIEGATIDPRRYSAVRTLLSDSTVTTPAEMQALAAKYLTRGKSWRLAVLPQVEASLAKRVGPQVQAGGK